MRLMNAFSKAVVQDFSIAELEKLIAMAKLKQEEEKLALAPPKMLAISN